MGCWNVEVILRVHGLLGGGQENGGGDVVDTAVDIAGIKVKSGECAIKRRMSCGQMQ